jgi:peptidoglycan biosynthesis protein MviN/MurJ (putative lipid II flippase)
VTYTKLEIIGLAISASLGNLTQCIGLSYLFIKTVDGFEWQETAKKSSKILASSVLAGMATWLSVKFLDIFILDTSRTLYLLILLFITSLLGFTIYLISSSILKIEEFHYYQNQLQKLKHFLYHS